MERVGGKEKEREGSMLGEVKMTLERQRAKSQRCRSVESRKWERKSGEAHYEEGVNRFRVLLLIDNHVCVEKHWG